MALAEVLAPLGPPLQPVTSTTDPDEAQLWHDTLPAAIGTEGTVIKKAGQAYPRREQRI
ncbi:hypothetical protein AB0G73_22225 [Streptomyces sp. NPDC020719]|uniref:hypothetical protein n=1 Tax=Streptomyces sp. NPDC020719 TaxID=3154896 RepID=UPI0033CD8813